VATDLDPTTTTATGWASDDDLGHVWCCQDEDIGLCGVDLTGQGYGPGAGECVVCSDLEGTAFCPRGFTCPEATE
jgi:hypothetical protein